MFLGMLLLLLLSLVRMCLLAQLVAVLLQADVQHLGLQWQVIAARPGPGGQARSRLDHDAAASLRAAGAGRLLPARCWSQWVWLFQLPAEGWEPGKWQLPVLRSSPRTAWPQHS